VFTNVRLLVHAAVWHILSTSIATRVIVCLSSVTNILTQAINPSQSNPQLTVESASYIMFTYTPASVPCPKAK
jgi:hypothetical protein